MSTVISVVGGWASFDFPKLARGQSVDYMNEETDLTHKIKCKSSCRNALAGSGPTLRNKVGDGEETEAEEHGSKDRGATCVMETSRHPSKRSE